jgi:hypothetical protein
MRSSRALAIWMAVSSVAACTGTGGDLLRTRSDAAAVDAARPRPQALSSWQIQLSGVLDTTVDVRVYVADMDIRTSTIRDLHDAGRIVICYFSAGSAESFRADASLFPSASLGAAVAGYPDVRWIDPRDATVRAIMADRIAKAAAAGCDGIHPSGLSAYAQETGFAFTRADQEAYGRWLTTVAHGLGLSIGFVENDPGLSGEIVGDFDWTAAWSCIETACPSVAPFVAAGKAAFLVEYGDETRAADVCPRARALGLSAIVKRSADLDAYRVGCL